MRNDRNKAIAWRRVGHSYNEISSKFKIPKSTLSGWFKKVKGLQAVTVKNIEETKRQWASNITAYNKRRSKQARHNWLIMQKEAASEIKNLSERELKLVGAALYWAEGYRRGNWSVVFCNSDPVMVRLMMEFFLKICRVPKSKIRCQIQIHHNISAPQATAHWQKITKLPSSQFLKPIRQVSRSSKLKRKNNLPYGTLRIKINDVKLVNRIKGWIVGLSR